MIKLAYREGFITNELTDGAGRRIEVYDWMRDQVFIPLDGYKSWPRDRDKLCRSCKPPAGTFHMDVRAATVMPHGRCKGLEPHRTVVNAVVLKRQQGKTTTCIAYALSELALARNSNILYLGSSEDQSKRIFDDKFVPMVESSSFLKKHLKPFRDSIRNPKRNNILRYIPASPKASVGGTWRLVVIDEARDIHPQTIARLLPTVTAVNGLECTNGCYTCENQDDPPPCPVCGDPLFPYQGRVLILSNAGEEGGWLHELMEVIGTQPHPNFHVFHTDRTLNKHFSDEAAGAIGEVFQEMTSTGRYMRQEFGNDFTSSDDEFLPRSAIERATVAMPNLDRSDARCVGFLDCSRTGDLTSLVICSDPDTGSQSEDDGGSDFDKLDMVHLQVWDPLRMRSGRVSYSEIRQYLAKVIPNFPRLIECRIDVALITDAQELLDWCRTQPWGQVFKGIRADRLTNVEIWDSLSRRVLTGPPALRMMKNDRLQQELLRAKIRVNASGTPKVTDATNNHSRGRMHRDISLSLAGCCWLADRYRNQARKPTIGISERLNTSDTLGRAFKPLTGGLNKASGGRAHRW